MNTPKVNPANTTPRAPGSAPVRATSPLDLQVLQAAGLAADQHVATSGRPSALTFETSSHYAGYRPVVGGGRYTRNVRHGSAVSPASSGSAPVAPAPRSTAPAVAPQAAPASERTEAQKQAMRDQIRSQLTPEAQAAFDRLGDKLDQKDIATGHTTLEHLNTLAQLGVSAALTNHGVTKQAVLSDLVQELDNPGLIHQSDHGTCGATTSQYCLASSNPAEYSRVVTELMQGTGTVTLAGGGTLQRDPSSLARDFSTRNDVDRMFQTAEMENSELGHYDNRTDNHVDASGNVTREGGLSQDDVTRLLNDFEGGKQGARETVYGNDADVIEQIKLSLAKGSSVPVGMAWSAGGRDASHELLVTKIENGKVYLRNPWGQEENGSLEIGPNRQVLNGTGDIVMSFSDFANNLQDATIRA